ncbi:hypothetical protein JD844_015181 [Phrynosoma platyrhinos]|uniref:Ig-like domain-containing protein n=1 Tax=Phrynosoma platyrhinos TaxID=52577 RepID=A0ABQ7T7G9_PHRPL|nr:hypothetical protein JD844_015181 [Phrynosoma platyrhinos]
MTQSASESMSLGGTVKVSCTASGTVSFIAWLQQKPGQPPRYVHCNTCSRGAGIPERFTASLSGRTGYLTITTVQAEDEAVYYCHTWFSSISSWHSGTVSQPTLTQPASMSTSPGETIKLSCSVSNNINYVGWYQQKPGQEGPRYVQADGYSRGPGIPDRFTASRSGNMGYLTITNVHVEDEAYYYCGMWYSSGSMFHSGAA